MPVVHGWYVVGMTCMPLFMDGGWGSLACLCSWMVVGDILHAFHIRCLTSDVHG